MYTGGGNLAELPVYRRLQDPEADDRSISSTSNETDADEYHSLIDESYRKSKPKLGYEAHRRSITSTGGNNCTRNRIFLCFIGVCCFMTVLMNMPWSAEKGRVGEWVLFVVVFTFRLIACYDIIVLRERYRLSQSDRLELWKLFWPYQLLRSSALCE